MMKNFVLFILSFLFFGLLTFSCGKAFAISGCTGSGQCVAYYWQCWSAGTAGNNLMWDAVPTGGTPYECGASNTTQYGGALQDPFYYCREKTYIYKNPGAPVIPYWNLSLNRLLYLDEETADAFRAYYEGLGIPEATEPESYWPAADFEYAETCSEPSVNCSELTDQVEELLVFDGLVSSSQPLCSQGCELTNNGVSAAIRKDDCDSNGTADDPCTIFTNLKYTGEDCPQGDPESEDDPGCSYWQQLCEELCVGGDMNFSCNETTGEHDCGCLMPEYPLIQSGGGFKPDQDEDGNPTGDPSETDADNDGDPDTTDPDPDGDGITFNDGDPDGDGQDNRGQATFQNNPTAQWSTSHNGFGTDPDGDNDGDTTSNCSDDDIDGDGIPNDQDPDMDGDGVPNTSDIDADGCDGIDGAGEGEEGDPAADADTNQDGVVDETDPPAEGEEWPTEEEVDQGYNDVGDNTYDGNVEGDFTDPDLGTTIQGYIDGNPFADNINSSTINLNSSDSCFRFPNPYEGGEEVYCLNQYESYWNAMGLILLGLTGMLCFIIIKG
jgi:hypothetical protein